MKRETQDRAVTGSYKRPKSGEPRDRLLQPIATRKIWRLFFRVRCLHLQLLLKGGSLPFLSSGFSCFKGDTAL
ncbi:hypothetical protein L6164_032472 [Bauhinia variegata]|uniref:Uncharacterized protein n=1 Tax=Bauhinia variegata TaxID=167791 RepID=A0ACB9KNR3_BAUVA|nr:hypothetical protein L6164_032472 [Bauhinia variegata]